MTIAVGVNKMPQAPSGPARDSSRYTASPTTTEGSASSVFSNHTSAPWPGKRATASAAPKASPMAAPNKQAVPLTRSDRPTICSSAGSALTMRWAAMSRLSVIVLMTVFMTAFMTVFIRGLLATRGGFCRAAARCTNGHEQASWAMQNHTAPR